MRRRLGKQAPRYRFFFNPYKYTRFTTCPQCGNETLRRKFPLFIHVHPMEPVLLNKTCRYCPHCDLLIAHQNDIEDLLAKIFTDSAPKVVGKDYLVVGTVDRADWKRIEQNQLFIEDTLEALHDFEEAVTFELKGGWQI